MDQKTPPVVQKNYPRDMNRPRSESEHLGVAKMQFVSDFRSSFFCALMLWKEAAKIFRFIRGHLTTPHTSDSGMF